MSHEIRTPLNAIVGLAHLVRRDVVDDAGRRRLAQISDAARHLLALVDDVLNLSRIDAGDVVLDSEDFALDELLSRSCAVVADAARQKGLELVIDVGQMPCTLRGDLHLLTEALVHLLTNAIKFSQRGVVTLAVSTTDAGEGSVLARFEVRDTGLGIPAEKLAQLFSSFGQVDGTTTRKHGGAGLGLAITKKLATLMGGGVGVRSVLGSGSVFWMSARLQVIDQPPNAKLEGPLAGRRVMLVDDLADAREAIGEMLRLLGLRVDLAESGAQAIEMADQAQIVGDPYDVMLIDRVMPGMNGLQTAQALMAEAGAAMPAFIMVSAMVDAGFIAQARNLDITSVLRKPVSFASLHGHLLRVLLDRAADQAAAANDAFAQTADELREQFAGSRVLLAEDHSLNQFVATRLLQTAGLLVDVAATGTEVLSMAAEHEYDLILMDVQMPEMDGLEATRRIRGELCLTDVPIIAMTANAFVDDRKACIDAGMDDHISKPVEPAWLYSTLARWLTANTRTSGAGDGGVDDEGARPVGRDPSSHPLLVDAALPHALTHFEGLSTSHGLRFFGNDPATYQSALGQFAAMYAQGLPGGARVDPDPASDAAKRLQREVHSLAGVSGAIGATALRADSERVEAMLREPMRRPDAATVERLDAALIEFAVRLSRELGEPIAA